MEIEEMIKFLPSLKSAYFDWNVKYGKKIKLTKIKMNKHIIDEIIRLLQRGEKFEKMWEELNVKFGSVEIYDSIIKYKNKAKIKDYSILEFVRLIIIKDIKQKYFPKEK